MPANALHSPSRYGCLRCQVTWLGDKDCWVCHDAGTLIVAANVIDNVINPQTHYYPEAV